MLRYKVIRKVGKMPRPFCVIKLQQAVISVGFVALLCFGVFPGKAVETEPPVASTLEVPKAQEAFRAFDRKQGVAYLDQAAREWRQYHGCTSCHSTFAYIIARSGENNEPAPEAMKQALAQVEKRVEQGDQIAPWYKATREGSSRQTEAIMNALALTVNDRNAVRPFRAVTRKALDQMWMVRGKKWQQGTWQAGNVSPVWNWLNFELGPWESNKEADAGAVLALVATGMAPDTYQQQPVIKQGVAAVRDYLKQHPSPLLHHRLLELWAEATQPGLLTAQEKANLIQQARQLQNTDGGWSTARLYARQEDSMQAESDGYGTGFTLLLLRKAQVPAEDMAIQRGLAWLRQHQRQSGAWQTFSLNPSLHDAISLVPARFPTHIGTAFVLMALQACSQ